MKEDFNPKKSCILNLFETGSIAKLVYFLNFFPAEIIKVATEWTPQRPVQKTCRPGNLSNSDKKLATTWDRLDQMAELVYFSVSLV